MKRAKSCLPFPLHAPQRKKLFWACAMTSRNMSENEKGTWIDISEVCGS